jgi:hypothetical protein
MNPLLNITSSLRLTDGWRGVYAMAVRALFGLGNGVVRNLQDNTLRLAPVDYRTQDTRLNQPLDQLLNRHR